MTHLPCVLIVEDDPAIVDLVTEVLVDARYRAQAVSTAAEALTRIDTDEFDLVILDWMLPDGRGDQLCRAIKVRSERTFLPVLMLTARNNLEDRVAGLEAGADDYLTKPFYVDELLARARALLRIRLAELERARALSELARQHAMLQEAYEQLRATQAQLVRASKLAALSELVAGIAHELNNPLAVILGNAELLPAMENETDRQSVAQIIAHVHRARRIVQSLMTFARRGRLDEEWYNPRDLVEQAISLQRARLEQAGVRLEVQYDPALPVIWVDGARVQQAILNLLMNACDALQGHPDPRIHIRVYTSTAPLPPPDLAPTAKHGEQPPNQAVVVDIADNGPGLPPEVVERIFQPFVTTKPVGQGTGLGLAIAYGIVEQHGGRLLFSSAPEHGTMFRIVLPIDADSHFAKTLVSDSLPGGVVY